MVDFTEVQTAYYLVAATGVLIAAIYYVFNMRATLQTRRIGLMDSIATRIVNKDGFRDYFELLNSEWVNYEDFDRKYGSEKNVDAAAQRYAVWTSFNRIGARVLSRVLLHGSNSKSPLCIWNRN